MSGSRGKNTRGYTTRNRVALIKGGTTYFALLERLIDSARHSLQLQVYIFEEDQTGKQIGAALIRAARRGVAVYLLVDGYASRNLSRDLIRELKDAGVQFRYFEPLLRTSYFYIGRRMHHKVVVADATQALVGGINIADRYNDFPSAPAWMDTALYIKGEAAVQLFQACRVFWGRNLVATLPLPKDVNFFLHTISENGCSVRIRRNDWLKLKTEISKTYLDLFCNAAESITIMCSYFLPGRRLRKALAKAAARGVNVKVILAGQSDVTLAKWAERYLYSWLFEQGIAVYEYQPTVVHAKIAVVDEHWVTVGSYNINDVSSYASIEMNADVRNKPFAKEVAHLLDAIITNDCVSVTPEKFRPYSTFLKRSLQKLSFGFIALVLELFTFYFPHQKT